MVKRLRRNRCDEPSDEQILDEVRRGDEAATQQLFERYFPLLRERVRKRMPRRLRRKVGESDVIQDAYLAAVRRLAEFQDRGEGSFGGWLMTIVDHKVADQVRRYMGTAKRDVKRESTRSDSKQGPDGETDSTSVSERARREEAVKTVLDAIENLDARERTLIELVHFEGQSIADVAEVEGATVDATRMRYSRALVRLRRLLESSEEDLV